MENLILKFMRDYWPEEVCEDYIEIFETLYAVVPEEVSSIDLFMTSLNDDDSIDFISTQIRTMTGNILEKLLNDMGVFLQEDFDITNAHKVYSELLLITENENINHILAILEDSEEAPSVKLFEVLDTIGGLMLDEGEFRETIRKVLPDTIEKFCIHLNKKLLFINVEPTDEEIQKSKKIALDVKAFIKALNDDNFFMIDNIKDGMCLGLGFDSMMNIFLKDIIQMEGKEAVYNLYILSLCSLEGNSNPSEYLGSRINEFIYDIDLASAIARTARDLQIKIGIYGK